jgi:hypothetical protein
VKKSSTTLFLSSKPEEKTEMIGDGFNHVASRFQKISKELKILNAWIRLMPGLLADAGAVSPEDRWQSQLKYYVAAGDSLAEAMVENAEALTELETAMNFYNKIDPDND